VLRMSAAEEPAFLQVVQDFRMHRSVKRLERFEAERELSEFFSDSFIHYRVPDTIFDEALLLNVLAGRAVARGVEFRGTHARLIAWPSSVAGVLVETELETIEPHYLVLCAGAGIRELLHPLGVT